MEALEKIRQHNIACPTSGEIDQSNLSDEDMQNLQDLLKKNNASLIAHYYTDFSLQKAAEATGGFVGDSLEMAKFGKNSQASHLIIAGVRFMGETAKILSPHKQVSLLAPEATCSLDILTPAASFKAFIEKHPEREVVVYANTSAEVKALADWVVTSSIAVDLIEYLDSQDKKILWAPDKYLGSYIQKKTGADMLLWDAACIVHEEFKAHKIQELKNVYPEAAVLVHPESPEAIIALADAVGSTSQLIKASQQLDNPIFIVATDKGIFYKMQQLSPEKEFIIAPTAGKAAECHACAHCPWMAMNKLQDLFELLQYPEQAFQISIPEEIRQKAQIPLEKMVAFQKQI